MEKYCASQHSPRAKRRLNGLQVPLHCLQVLGWVVFAATCAINFLILVQIQLYDIKIASEILYGVLYVLHFLSQLSASLMDPSEKGLRKLKVNNVPEFDRRVHAHVIENGRCHLCNIYTTSKKTKHCSICNKCVDHFDHHCKWLNNCIGRRNYKAFMLCVISALLISLLTTLLCIADIVYFIISPQMLSVSAQNYINCTVMMDATVSAVEPQSRICKRSITFLMFLIMLSLSAVAISFALTHLCCFHVYISILGISTYEYIVSYTTEDTYSRCANSDLSQNHSGKCLIFRHHSIQICKTKNNPNYEIREQTASETDEEREVKSDLANLTTTILRDVVDKARKILYIDKNKIHPQPEQSNS